MIIPREFFEFVDIKDTVKCQRVTGDKAESLRRDLRGEVDAFACQFRDSTGENKLFRGGFCFLSLEDGLLLYCQQLKSFDDYSMTIYQVSRGGQPVLGSNPATLIASVTLFGGLRHECWNSCKEVA